MPGTLEPTDQILAARARSGCRAAFDELAVRYHDRLLAFLRQRVGNDEDARELAQDALFAAWKCIHRYDGRHAFSTWLFTIGARRAISRMRRRFTPLMRAQIGRRAAAISSAAPDPSAAAVAREEQRNIWALAECVLTDVERAALWLRYAEDLPGSTIAQVLRVSHANTRVLLHRAKRKMLAALEASAAAAARCTEPDNRTSCGAMKLAR